MSKLTIQQACKLALENYQNGFLAEAAETSLRILARLPNHLDSLRLMGLIASQSERDDLAVTYFGKACGLAPKSHELLCYLGEAQRRTGELAPAVAAFRKAILLRPGYTEAHNNLGIALRDGGQMEEALAAFRQAVALDAGHVAARNNLGAALMETGNLDEAVATFLKLLEIDPDDAETLVNLGVTLAKQEKLDAAIIAYRQAIALDPRLTVAYRNLGNSLEKIKRLDEAIATYQQALAIDPNLAEVHNNLGNALKECGRIEEAIAAYRCALAASPDYSDAHSNLLFCLHYSAVHDAAGVLTEHLRWNQLQAARWKSGIPQHTNDRSPERRLRIGYVSPDFRNHPVTWFLLPLLENHDKSQVEVFAYAQARVCDGWTERVMARADHWRSLVDLTDDRAARLIREDGIDILVDLALHSAGNRLLVFARKPAPIQATWLAYAGTSGLETMDYRLSDPFLDPDRADDSVYSETTLRLPQNYWCYQQPEADLATSQLPAVGDGFVTFGCLNNFCKINDGVLNLWARLLEAVPDSRLHLHANEGAHRCRVLELMKTRGVDPQRVHFIPDVPISDYFGQYNHIDIALDPFPYGGGTTTCDALWMGVPVITLRGRTAVGRGGASILSNIGLSELVADSEEDYLRIAAELAGDLPYLTVLRSTMRDRMVRSPLMDGPAFARAMEAAYRQMWRTWCDAKPGS
jgi:protein O-GlcNAc transferase